MLRIARLNKIKELLYENSSVVVVDLTKRFKVSKETIRRDLQELEDDGFLTRSYGGAFITDAVKADVDVDVREHIHVQGKKKIANKCAELIKTGDSVFLDASTTSLYVADMICDKKITIITNSLKIINKLMKKENVNLVILGGSLDHISLSTLGRNAKKTLGSYFFDFAIISCTSVSIEHGLMDSNESQAEIRRIAIENAKQTIIAVDYTKLNRISFASIGDFSKVDLLVCDDALSSLWKKFLSLKGIEYFEMI